MLLEGSLKLQTVRVVDPTVVVVSVAVECLASMVFVWVALVAVAVIGGSVCLPVISTYYSIKQICVKYLRF